MPARCVAPWRPDCCLPSTQHPPHPAAAAAFASSAGRQRTSTLLSPRALHADGNGQVTKDEFAQVYSQLFVDDAPERIDEVGSIYSIEVKLNPLYPTGGGEASQHTVHCKCAALGGSPRSAAPSAPAPPHNPRLALPPLAPAAITAQPPARVCFHFVPLSDLPPLPSLPSPHPPSLPPCRSSSAT